MIDQKHRVLARYDYLIIGQGIAGSVISFKLIQQGYKIRVVDTPLSGRSSSVAAGIINPVTGRNYVKSWLIDALLPSAVSCYEAMKDLLGPDYLIPKSVYRALHSAKDENAWMARTGDTFYQDYLGECTGHPADFDFIKPAYNQGYIKKAYQLRIKNLIMDFRAYLHQHNALIEEVLKIDSLQDLHQQLAAYDCKQVVFCEGHQVVHNPLWNYLPFDPVKGEMLYVKIPQLKLKDNYRHKMFLTHLYEDIYWVGASYIKNYENADITLSEKEKMTAFLEEILETDFEILEQKAGIRPAVKTRKPLLGRHPEFPNYFLFNGLGAKGSSLAPYFADMLIDYIEKDIALITEVDIAKYHKDV